MNHAAWLNAARGQLDVSRAPYPALGRDQVVVRNHALAVNPLDWIIQDAGHLTYRWLKYPAVIGSDVAGEVAAVGRDVTRFKVGDRVLGHGVGTDKDSNNPAGRRFVSIATPPVSFDGLAGAERPRLAAIAVGRTLVTSNIGLQVRARSGGVRLKYIWGTSLKGNEVAAAVYGDFLPSALAAGRYAAVPEPLIAGHPLEDLQHALDVQRGGVSAAKVVVTLPPAP